MEKPSWLVPGLEPSYQRLLELLRTRAYRKGTVTLSSGGTSDFYVDCKAVTLSAEGHFLVGKLINAVLDAQAPQALAVGGLTLGADPMVSAVSLMSFLGSHPRHGFLVRKEPKGHGTGQWIEGHDNLAPNMPVVLVEDVITTGASLLKAADRAQEFGLQVIAAVALVDRHEGGYATIAQRFAVTALYNKSQFV